MRSSTWSGRKRTWPRSASGPTTTSIGGAGRSSRASPRSTAGVAWFGGTPSNLAISVLDQDRVEVIAGVNLPMLIKLASLRGEESLATVVDEAQRAGRKYINVASQLLADEAQ